MWVEEECKDKDEKAFLKNHLIPENISLSLSNIEEFLKSEKSF